MHVDEGTIHAWLDGELPPDEAAQIEEHIGTCAACGAAVAEARGLMAASSRILGALDDVPGGVTPVIVKAPTVGNARPRRRWWQHPQFAAAAALVVMVVGSFAVIRETGDVTAKSAAPAAPVAAEVVPEAAPALAREEAAQPAQSRDVLPRDLMVPSVPRQEASVRHDSVVPAASAAASNVVVGATTDSTRVGEAEPKKRSAVSADALVSAERDRLAGERRVQLESAAASPPAPPSAAPAPAARRAVAAEKSAPLMEVVTTGASGAARRGDAAGAAGSAVAMCFDLQRSTAAVAAGVPSFVQLVEMAGPTVNGRALRSVVSSAGAGWHWYRVMDGGLFLAHVVDGSIAYEVRFTGLGTTDVVGTERPCVSR